MKKKILAAVIVVAAAGILAGVFFQKNPAGEIRGLTGDEAAADVVRAAVAAENEQDWDTYLLLLTEDERTSMAGFLEDEAHQANHSGVLNVKAARIEDMQTLPWEENKGAVLQSDVYEETYDEIALYRVSIDYDVYRSDKYYSEGINERLFVLGKRDGQWWLLETPMAP